MKLFSLIADNFMLDGGACFGVVPKSLWMKSYPVDKNNLLKIPDRCLLIQDGEKLILVDNGIGDKQDEKFYSYRYMFGEDSLEKSFKKHGFNFDDVTDVILTHLHFDHCGGGIKYSSDKTKFEATFKNARYWCSKQQWDWAINPNKREKPSFLKENILPMQELGLINFIHEDTDFTANVKLNLFNGHTMGQIIPFVRYKGKTFVFMADFIPTSAHIPLSYIPSFDVHPLITLKEKEEFLKKASEEEYVLIFEHDYYVECCTVERIEKNIRIKEKFIIDEI